MSLRVALVALVLVGCSSDPPPFAAGDVAFVTSSLTAAQRRARAEQIRDAASANGLQNGWMLAGIADAETNMSHCWSEATWACQGPTHADCGGPVIAGSADGPCSARQGGLGMFQFDAGTYDQTLAREGDRVLSIAGNVAAAVDFTVAMVIRSTFISGVDTNEQAIAWMNRVQVDGNQWTEWIHTVVRYYNGCSQSSSCWTGRVDRYGGRTRDIYNEMGAAFWQVSGSTPTGTPLAAELVSQSFPAATVGWSLAANEEFTGYFELRNTGSATWRPGSTFLAVTNPRDVPSAMASASWSSPTRPATVDREVPPQGVGRFMFSVRAPAGVASASQFFNLFQDGMYFEAPGDNGLQLTIGVLMSSCPAGVGEIFACAPDGGRHRCVAGSYEHQPCPNGCQPSAPEAICTAGVGDADGDGYPAGADCDDNNAFVFPGQADTCGDGLDANCDGVDACAGGPVPPAGVDAGMTPGVTPPRSSTTVSSGCSATGRGVAGGWFVVLLFGMRRRR